MYKPFSKDLKASVSCCIKDARCLSLMWIMKANLCRIPVYFNVYKLIHYPYLTLSLTDQNLFGTVSFNIKTHGYEFLSGSEMTIIIYQIH